MPYHFCESNKLGQIEASQTPAKPTRKINERCENAAAAFPIQGRRLAPHVEIFSTWFSLNSAFNISMNVSSFSQDEVFFFPPLNVKGNLKLVWKENSQVALILFCTFRSAALPLQTSFFLQTRTCRETSAAVCQTHGCFSFFLFLNPKNAQINISHKHCTFIVQNKPSELHVNLSGQREEQR